MSAADDLDFSEETEAGQALLRFMMSATSNPELADDMAQNPSKYLEKLSFTVEHNILGDDLPTVTIRNVPDTVNPVKARMAFIQAPVDGTNYLNFVWKVR